MLNKKQKSLEVLPMSLQEEKRLEIIRGFYYGGYSIEELAYLHNKRKDAIERILDTYNKRRSVKRKKGSGRPEKLEYADKRRIKSSIKKNPKLSCEDLRDTHDIDCTPETNRNHLHKQNFSYRKPDFKPLLSAQDKIDRLEWAQYYRNYEFDDAMFLDEATFYLDSSSGKRWLQKGFQPVENEFFPEKLNVCAAISAQRTGPLMYL